MAGVLPAASVPACGAPGTDTGEKSAGTSARETPASSVPSGKIQPGWELPSLADIYREDFKIGNVFGPDTLSGDSFRLIRRHFNILTAENDMKPASLTREKGVYDFDTADAMLSEISAAGIAVHGHTLGWHAQSAAWLNTGVTRTEAAENMRAYVQTVAGHFRGKVVSWDVLNEGVDFSGSFGGNWHDALRRDSDWYAAFGSEAKKGENPWDYVELLFREARKADPDAVLYYNDYNLNLSEKADAVCAMVQDINDRYRKETGGPRLLIEGVGMQGHYTIGTDPKSVEKSIQKFLRLGVRISISELDVGVPGAEPDGLTPEQEKRQAIVYAKLFQIFKKHAASIDRVTFWGLDDARSWRAESFPLLFNGDLSAKQAYYAVADPDGYLAKVGSEETFRQSAEAAPGTPVLGKGQDPAWDKAREYPVTQQLQAWNYASGTMKALWDSDALYVRVQVRDASLDASSANAWEQDSVECFVSESDNRTDAYGDGDGQYRVSFRNDRSFGSTDGAGVQSAVEKTEDGYCVTMKIPFRTVKPASGTKMGFDVQINDAADGVRKGVVTWNDPTGRAYTDPSVFGEIILR